MAVVASLKVHLKTGISGFTFDIWQLLLEHMLVRIGARRAAVTMLAFLMSAVFFVIFLHHLKLDAVPELVE